MLTLYGLVGFFALTGLVTWVRFVRRMVRGFRDFKRRLMWAIHPRPRQDKPFHRYNPDDHSRKPYPPPART